MNLSAIHKSCASPVSSANVVCDIGGYEFVSYSQGAPLHQSSVCGCL